MMTIIGGKKMGCFTATIVEAAVVTVAEKIMKSKEISKAHLENTEGVTEAVKLPFSKKLGWLSKLLWGGSALLAFEHVWHGEVTPWFPFLTAAANPADTAVMLQEIATVGTSMCLLITLVWGGMVVVAHRLEKKADEVPSVQE